MSDAAIPQYLEDLATLDHSTLLEEIERLWREDPTTLKRLAAYVNERRHQTR
jgi:hypothetical protein